MTEANRRSIMGFVTAAGVIVFAPGDLIVHNGCFGAGRGS